MEAVAGLARAINGLKDHKRGVKDYFMTSSNYFDSSKRSLYKLCFYRELCDKHNGLEAIQELYPHHIYGVGGFVLFRLLQLNPDSSFLTELLE